MRLHTVLTLLFLSLINFTVAQNVGIGTTTPAEKLEVKNPLRSTVKISAGSLADTTQVIFNNTGSSSGFYTDFSIKSVREEGLFFSSTSDLAVNTSSNSLVIRPGGNIGLGINLPAYRLQVNEPVAASTYMSFTNPITGSTVTDGLVLGLTGNSGILYNLENSSLQLGTNGNTRLMIEADGDVGIGTISPTAKLHINGGVKLEGLNIFEFGAGVAGKEVNAGKIGYNGFGQNGLVFVGGGTNASNRSFYFFGEGGTTFSGPATVTGNVNIAGQLQMNGIPGTAGQVLTSNGAADPAWTNASFGNSVRFAASYSDDLSSYPSTNSAFTSIYNYSPADISISATTITVNKSGLYHIEGYMNANANFASAPSYIYTSCFLYLDGNQFHFAYSEPFNLNSNFAFQYNKVTHFSQDIYLTAPATVTPFGSIGSNLGATSRSLSGKITGYLISE